jgi:hypothetical protein
MPTGKGNTLSHLACTGHVLPVAEPGNIVSTAALTEDPERRDHLQLAAHTPGFSLLVQRVQPLGPCWNRMPFPLKWPGLPWATDHPGTHSPPLVHIWYIGGNWLLIMSSRSTHHFSQWRLMDNNKVSSAPCPGHSTCLLIESRVLQGHCVLNCFYLWVVCFALTLSWHPAKDLLSVCAAC